MTATQSHGHDDGDEYFCEPASPEEFDIVADARMQVAKIISRLKTPTLTITRFKGTKDNSGIRRDISWAKLGDVLSSPNEAADIDSLPLIKFSELPNNSRAKGTQPKNMTAVVGDYDGGQVSVTEAVAMLSQAGISAMVYTTRRHRPEAPRWRVVAQLSAPLSCAEYIEHLDALNGALGGIFAPESWEQTRCYFYGKVEGVAYSFAQVDGLPIDSMLLGGIGWSPIGKPGAGESKKPAVADHQVLEDDRDFERTITINKVTDLTLQELYFALEAIKDRAEERCAWNETFLAMVSLKGTEHEAKARSITETWCQKHSAKWCEKEDDATKWDRENSRDITYTSVFSWADEADRRTGVFGTDRGWRALASAALVETEAAALGTNVLSFADFCSAMEPPRYVWHRVLQTGCLYALTAKWGHGKTALMLSVAMHVAVGRELGGHSVDRQRVLYLCGENPEDVKLRARAAALKFDISTSELDGQIYFTRRPFSLDDPTQLKRFLKDATKFGTFGMVVIDTGPAHSSAEEENDNREMHKLAMAMRDLMGPLGNPATVALMHPTKEATRDNLQPRGGGAFSGSIDGELCAWQEHGQVEFFHRTKFRGPGFEPMWFALERFELPGMQDNFGEPVITVLAMQTDADGVNRPARVKPLTGAQAIAHKALEAALSDLKTSEFVSKAFGAEAAAAINCPPPEAAVHLDAWRAMTYDMGISDGDGEAKKKAFKRAREKLVEIGLVKVWKDMCWLRGAA
jgi:hypothetical protein